jgi:YggT family protein
MAAGYLVNLISLLANLILWLVIIYAVLGYFVSPYHPLMEFLRRLVSPMLDPIRRIMPQTGMLDFSPVVLLILVQLVRIILISLIRASF